MVATLVISSFAREVNSALSLLLHICPVSYLPSLIKTMERFDVARVVKSYEKAFFEDDDILLYEYIEAYREINKFFISIGTLFSFVSSDVSTKLDILCELMNADKSNFNSIKTMMAYEMQAGLLKDKNYVSGCRTLLRLHRGLEFTLEFLNSVTNLAENEKTTSCCQDSYNKTLAKYHPWLVRKGAGMAMHALPTQGELLKRVTVNVEEAVENLPNMIQLTRKIYNRTQGLYESNALLDLP